MANRAFLNLGSFATFTRRVALVSDVEFHAGLGLVAGNIKRSARLVVGDQQKLKPLADSTVESKDREGYPFPDAPLYASGDMQRSIEDFHAGPIAGVGSESPKLLWHHLGGMTGRNHASLLPPRPVLDVAVIETEPENLLIMEAAAKKAVGI